MPDEDRKNMTIPSDLLSLVFPSICHICGTTLADGEHYICSACEAALPRTRYHQQSMNPMEQRFAGKFPFARASGHFFYSRDSSLSQLIQDFKYRHFPGLAHHLGRILGRELFPTGFFSGIDMIMPIPLHLLKKAQRGYNQTEHIASGISEVTGIPVSTALKARKPHRTQTSLSHDERIANTKDVFRIGNIQHQPMQGILLLDDVCTTGATLTSASETILKTYPGTKLTLLTLGVTF